MKWFFKLMLTCFLLNESLLADTEFDHFIIKDDGTINVGKADIFILHHNSKWSPSTQSHGAIGVKQTIFPAPGYPQITEKEFILEGIYKVDGSEFNFSEKIVRSGTDKIDMTFSVMSKTGVPTSCLALYLALPVASFASHEVYIDGTQLQLPQKYLEEKFTIYNTSDCKSFSVQDSDFILNMTPSGKIQIQDDRKFPHVYFQKEKYLVRIYFTPSKGTLFNSSVTVSFSTTPYLSAPIDMKNVFNKGFADPVAADGKGGWTDQGPNSDISMLPNGKKAFGSVIFDIVDPRVNDGKSCLVMGSKHVGGAVESASVDLVPQSMKYLGILHALAWPPKDGTQIGTIRINYTDATSSQIPIIAGVDVANWWNPLPITQGDLVWNAENKEFQVGLYRSYFPIQDKPVKSIDFINAGNSVWMIAGISAMQTKVPHISSNPYYITENSTWRKIDFYRDIESGSVLDFSSLNLSELPAGKHGKLIVRNGKFSFENNILQSQRFYGANLCFSANFPQKQDSERLARQLSKIGYNAVRLHHFDKMLCDENDPDRTKLNPEMLDKLDYLVKCLKDQGIYITIDLYTIREFPYNGNFYSINPAKALMILEPSARDNLKRFSSNLLTHVNPYTAIAWKDEPALSHIGFINEDPVYRIWKEDANIKQLYEQRFQTWLKKHKLTPQSTQEQARLMDVFIGEIYADAYSDLRDFIRGMGMNNPVSDQSCGISQGLTLLRNSYDYVDQHFYWDHPALIGGDWKLPGVYKNISSIEMMAAQPQEVFSSRILGKPYTITEFNYCHSNPYRAEGGALSGAYAAFQDWDALYRFAYAHTNYNISHDRGLYLFDSASDPVQMLSDKLGILLFLRRDVSPSMYSIPLILDNELTQKGQSMTPYPEIWNKMGLIAQTGTFIDGKNMPEHCDFSLSSADMSSQSLIMDKLQKLNTNSTPLLDFDKKFARTRNGELELDGSNVCFKVNTPRTVALVMKNEGTVECGVLELANKNDFACVSISALNGTTISASNRLLVLHLTNAMNNMTKFRDKTMKFLEHPGQLPVLVRRGIVELKIKLDPGTTPVVYAVDLAGRRIGRIDASFSHDGILRFTADTFTFNTPCMAYEIVR